MGLRMHGAPLGGKRESLAQSHILPLAPRHAGAVKQIMAKKAVPKKKPAPSSKPYWIGFDLGGTKMMACVLDANYVVLGSARKSTQGAQGAAKGVKRITTTIREAMEAANVRPEKIQGIGIGCPGTVNSEKGILITAPNLGWNKLALGPALQRVFKCRVATLNDVDAGTYGEFALGAGVGARSLLGVFPGTGLGAGFVYDGKLVQGRNVSCMELGNIWLPGTHLASTIPGAALLEDLTSRLGIASAASVECYRGKTPQLDAKTNASLREMKSKALTGSFKGGEEAIVNIFQNSIQYLGMGVAIVINLMAPDHITLGGGLVEEMPRFYLQALREQIAIYAIPELLTGVKFSIAKLGGEAVAIGAVAWLRNVKP
jgi:glucokinase